MKKNLLKSMLVALMVMVGGSAWAGDKTVVKYSFDDASSPEVTAGSRVSLDYTRASVITQTNFLNAWNSTNGDPAASTISLGSTDLSAETWTLSFEWAAVGGCNSKPDHTTLKAGDTNLFDLSGNSNWNTTVTLSVAGAATDKTLPVPGCDKSYRFTANTGNQMNTTAYWHHFVITGSSDGVKLTITNSSTGNAIVTDVVLSETNVNPTSLIIEPCCGGAIGIDELSLTYYVAGEVVQTPMAAYTKVDGINRTITATCDTEGATLYYSLDNENWTEGASVTVSTSGNVYFKAVKGSSESDVLTFAAEAGVEIVLNAPVIVRNANGTVTISADQSKLLLSPTATIYYTYGEENGSFTGSKELTVAADATITAYAEAEGYAKSADATRAVALFPENVNPLFSAAAATNGWSANAFSDETITASERTYATLMLDEAAWSESVLFQTDGAWGLRATGNWYINSNTANSWILVKDTKAGNIVVVDATFAPAEAVNATYAEKYSFGTKHAYTINADGNAEFALIKPSANEMDYLYGLYGYSLIKEEVIITPAYGTIWENGETTTDENENTNAEIAAAYFNNFAKANDTIRATVVVAAPARAAGPARIIATGNLSVFAGMSPIYEAANIPVGESKLDIALDNEDLAAIAEAGSLKFVYSNLTLKKVELIEGVADSATIAEQAKLQNEITKAEGMLADVNKTNGREDFQTAINAAKALLTSIDIDAIKAGITTLQAAEQAFIKANYFIEFTAGQYYIIDAESGKFMAAGHDYGTRGIVNEIGLDLTLTPNTESRMITIDTRVKNGNNHFLGTDLYMDAATTEWALEYQGFGFWITNGTKYISIDDKDNLVMSETPREWIIVTYEGVREQRMEELAEATKDAPKDATWAIQAPNFNRNDQRVDAWQISSDCTNKNLNGGNQTNNCAESWHSTFTISQTLTGMPKGVYALTAQGFYRQDDNATEDAPVFFANAETGAVPVKAGSENSMADASASFTNGSYVIAPIFVEVGENSTLAIGIKGTATHQWVIFDNFQLKYYGSAVSIDEIKNAAIYAEMLALREQLKNIKNEVEIQAIKDSIDSVLSSNENPEGAEAINATIASLKAALEVAQAYVKAKNTLPKMQQLTVETNFYTAEALQSYYTQWNEKYQAGTLTKTEADALQDPFLISDWRASVTVDDLLMSVWGVATEQWDNLHVNTWSTEGETDGSEFKVPFIEYWTGDANSLGEKALTATMSGLPEGNYQVGIRVRVRVKNAAQASATGITMNVNGETAVDVCAGTQVGETQFYLGEFTAVGDVYEDGVLKLNINVAAENNISWLSFKDVVYTRLGEVVGIAGVKSVNKLDGTIYNLNGQKMDKAQKGLYIINGKKVVVK